MPTSPQTDLRIFISLQDLHEAFQPGAAEQDFGNWFFKTPKFLVGPFFCKYKCIEKNSSTIRLAAKTRLVSLGQPERVVATQW
jgi:hypothetical protein